MADQPPPSPSGHDLPTFDASEPYVAVPTGGVVEEYHFEGTDGRTYTVEVQDLAPEKAAPLVAGGWVVRRVGEDLARAVRLLIG
jgi:hypothetical protein